MLHVTDMLPDQILSVDDGPAAEVVNPNGRAPVCLVCEHASAAIPSSLGALGLVDADRYSHAVWDIGAEELARTLSRRLDAPLVLARVSRLVYDCNRPPEREDAMPARTETIDIPGNRDLTPAERKLRTREIYDAFHATLSATLDAFPKPPAFVTIHSFTPNWFGQPRDTELGLLHDEDPTLARAMLSHSARTFRTELNRPYSAADGVTHTLARHATARGLRNVMIEVRNDLLGDKSQISKVADTLENMLSAALAEGADAA
jgi:predicted N-formylglutamate amidohydrolase